MTDDDMPDFNIDRLYAAVGHCLTTWEALESEMSHLYSIFVGRPRQIEALQEYGRENRIFSSRMKAIEDAAEAFFVRSPSQRIEGEFRDLVARCRNLAPARHQIAHGIVQGIAMYGQPDHDGWVMPTIGYCLSPPWYSFINLTKHQGVGYRYSSATIDQVATTFEAARLTAANLNARLDQTGAG